MSYTSISVALASYFVGSYICMYTYITLLTERCIENIETLYTFCLHVSSEPTIKLFEKKKSD